MESTQHNERPYSAEEITEAVRQALSPLRMYDAGTDRERAVTQDDIERGLAALKCLSRISAALNDFKRLVVPGEQ